MSTSLSPKKTTQTLTTHDNSAVFQFVVDRSASMAPLADATYEAVCGFLREQQSVFDDGLASILMFNDKSECGAFQRLKSVELSRRQFDCHGSTYLYEAIIRGVQHAETTAAPNVYVVIVTDGEDMSHQRPYKAADIVREKRLMCGWHFIYLGANHDAIFAANKCGIPRQTALTWNASKEGVRLAIESASNAVKRSRTGVLEITDDDRNKQIKLLTG